MRHNCDHLQTRPSGSSHLTYATVESLLPEYSIEEMVVVWLAKLQLVVLVSSSWLGFWQGEGPTSALAADMPRIDFIVVPH
jgi:hypothetical protein